MSRCKALQNIAELFNDRQSPLESFLLIDPLAYISRPAFCTFIMAVLHGCLASQQLC